MTIFCVSGVSYLLSRLVYTPCLSTEDNENDSTIIPREIEVTEESPLVNSPSSAGDEGDDDDLIENNNSRNLWIIETRQVPTFKDRNDLTTILIDKLINTLYPKTVRFDPISKEHVTFSREDYKRRNQEYFDNISELCRNPAQLFEIYQELKVLKAKMPKLETIKEHPDEDI